MKRILGLMVLILLICSISIFAQSPTVGAIGTFTESNGVVTENAYMCITSEVINYELSIAHVVVCVWTSYSDKLAGTGLLEDGITLQTRATARAIKDSEGNTLYTISKFSDVVTTSHYENFMTELFKTPAFTGWANQAP